MVQLLILEVVGGSICVGGYPYLVELRVCQLCVMKTVHLLPVRCSVFGPLQNICNRLCLLSLSTEAPGSGPWEYCGQVRWRQFFYGRFASSNIYMALKSAEIFLFHRLGLLSSCYHMDWFDFTGLLLS
jgi:hypothetical protein